MRGGTGEGEGGKENLEQTPRYFKSNPSKWKAFSLTEFKDLSEEPHCLKALFSYLNCDLALMEKKKTRLFFL